MTGSHNPSDRDAVVSPEAPRGAPILGGRPFAGDQAAASPRPTRLQRPRWLDFRLILGVLLVVGAVLIGSTVVSSADHRRGFWALQRDVPAGTALTREDLKPVKAQLGALAGAYLASDEAVLGRSPRRTLRAGELIARGELSTPTEGLLITVPVRADNAPPLARGDRVTFWLSTKDCHGAVLIGDVAVSAVHTPSAGALSSTNLLGIAVRLPLESANRVIAALDVPGAVIRVGVLAVDGAAPAAQADVARCWAAGS
jgi:hypothetical protein